MNGNEITLSVFRGALTAVDADRGEGSNLLEDAAAGARTILEAARGEGLIVDYHASSWGRAVALVVTHDRGEDDDRIHRLARQAFAVGGVDATPGLYDADRQPHAEGLLDDAGGRGYGMAEMTLMERAIEQLVILVADAVPASAWNLPLFETFADPCNLAGLLMMPTGPAGFDFEIHDVEEHRRIVLNTPDELCDVLAFVTLPGRYVVRLVTTRDGKIAAAPSRQRLSSVGGRSVATNDTVCIVRCEGQFPPAWKVLKPFTRPCAGERWRRGVHGGPLTPVRLGAMRPRVADRRPHVAALGFQIADGRLVGPRDMFDDPDFDEARRTCGTVDDHEEWAAVEDARYGLPADAAATSPTGHTGLTRMMERLEGRWEMMPERTARGGWHPA